TTSLTLGSICVVAMSAPPHFLESNPWRACVGPGDFLAGTRYLKPSLPPFVPSGGGRLSAGFGNCRQKPLKSTRDGGASNYGRTAWPARSRRYIPCLNNALERRSSSGRPPR